MDAEWIKSPTARRVLVHWADARPAWLWSQDGETLLWRNEAARFFHGKVKKHGVKLAPEAVPIKGQIARLIRLGSTNRSSLSRIQFLAGDRPISTTCSCTPLLLADGSTALLIVGVDAIEPELLEAQDFGHVDPLAVSLFPAGAEYLLVSDDSQIVGGSRIAIERYAPIIESEGLPESAGESGAAQLASEAVQLTRFTASPQDAMLLLFEGVPGEVSGPSSIEEVRREDGAGDADEMTHAPEPVVDEPWLPMGLPEAVTHAPQPEVAADEPWVEPIPEMPPQPPGTLSTLFDRLADDAELYTALSVQDETFAGPPPELPAEVFAEVEPELPVVALDEDMADAPVVEPLEVMEPESEAVTEPAPADEAESDYDPIAAMIESIEAATAVERERVTTWRIIGRGFEPVEAPVTLEHRVTEAPAGPVDSETVDVSILPILPVLPLAEAPEAMPPEPDQETVERVSRYNFDELSRILTDRVSGVSPVAEAAAPASSSNALVSLSGETFILNRLPLGIMVFRDQQVMFANRALTELTGYDSIDALRAAGLTAIFPAEDANAGPVTQLVRRDGSLVPVAARLQSINWHGKPALMLSASIAEPRESSTESAVLSYAEINAEMSEDGFFATDRSGVLTGVSLHARILLGETEQELLGRPLGQLIIGGEVADLKRFLERPARFAQTERPSIMLTGNRPDTRLTLFAEGQAGVVSGYFGTVRRLSTAIPVVRDNPPRAEDLEPSMLTRITRGVRRPLNSIIGFAELIRTTNDAGRHQEYARDVRMAGEEIATLVDELDDYARLREGRYEAKADDIELSGLLDSSLSRVRVQAAEARVLVRSAVSERLPGVTADRASLTQAILNLLASAIDQTPAGGTVILSAQREDDGAIVINVRDSGEKRSDLGERFVVFRDGVGKDGETLMPVRSSVGLALTRSLLAVNALKLNVDPAVGVGTLFSLVIPAELTRS